MNIRVVCAFDAEAQAKQIDHLLSIAGHKVSRCVGWLAANCIGASKASGEAVILVWSKDAYPQAFMREWMTETPLDRLVEIRLCDAYPAREEPRSHAPLNFSAWDGKPSALEWRELTGRLRRVASGAAPARPTHTRSAGAVAITGAVVVAAALVVRVQDQGEAAPPTMIAHSEEGALRQTFQQATQLAKGGEDAEHLPEPESMPHFEPLDPRVRTIAMPQFHLDAEAELLDPMSFRGPGLLSMVTGWARTFTSGESETSAE